MVSDDIEKTAIERLQLANKMSFRYYGLPLILTYSGGKDSDVCLKLCKEANIPFEVLHSHTTADAPETVYHVRDVFHQLECDGIKCTIDYHVKPDGKRMTMWNLIPKKLMPPTRVVRYCCSELKESSEYTRDRMIITGVRWDESNQRKSRTAYEAIGRTKKGGVRVSDEKMLLSDQDPDTRLLFERCQMKAKSVVNPIIDWKDKDIWDYKEQKRINLCSLYGCGFHRVGCVGCPMAGTKGRESAFSRYPKFKKAYIRAFDAMLDERRRKGLVCKWETGEEVFHWWIQDKNVFGQMSIEDMIDTDGNVLYLEE